MQRRIRYIDVFTAEPYRGNPVAVVLDGEGLSSEAMQRFARWTGLSETTFVTPSAHDRADYAVRIFTPSSELPFAGHPTLGTCHAWLAAGSEPRSREVVVQECGVGPVEIRRTSDGLAFKAPPLRRSGTPDESLVQRVASALNIDRAEIRDAEWVDNGPPWIAALLDDAEAVLALRPGDAGDLFVGAVGLHPPGSPAAIEVRAFFPKDGGTAEDPVTGSLNAALAPWLLRTGRISTPYVASQGTALDRAGRVHVTRTDEGSFWVGGGTVTCVTGEVDI